MSDLDFDIRDVSKKNPKSENRVAPHLYRTDHRIPRNRKSKKKWWDSTPIYKKRYDCPKIG